MSGAGESLGTAVFAARQVSTDGRFSNVAFVLACLVLALILLVEGWPRWRNWWAARKTGSPRLRYEENGRSGQIHFDNGRSRFQMYWEFGGGNALAVINVPTVAEWVARTGLPVAERAEVLRFIATQVIRDKTSAGQNRYEIGPSAITIFD